MVCSGTWLTKLPLERHGEAIPRRSYESDALRADEHWGVNVTECGAGGPDEGFMSAIL